MMTHGKCGIGTNLLNEALYHALNQTHKDIEVIVLNDLWSQKLFCADSRVRCVNVPDRFPGLGEKMKALIDMAQGEILLVNDDDDISLTHRAANAIKYLHAYQCFNPKRWYFHVYGKPMVPDGNGWGFNAVSFRRGVMDWQPGIDGHDRDTAGWAQHNLLCNPYTLCDDELDFVYRWNVSHCHLSGNSNQTLAYKQVAVGPAGEYHLEPRMGVYNYNADHAVMRARNR
jgi:hypothetical protein